MFSTFALVTATGCIGGSFIGGWTCRPSIQYSISFSFLNIILRYSNVFPQNGFWAEFPYFIPYSIACLQYFCAILLACKLLIDVRLTDTHLKAKGFFWIHLKF